MDVQELKVKVLYTVAPNTQAVMALTRRVPVTLIPSAEPGELGHGKVLLRHCLLAICHSNPDLIGDAAKDFSVYALDPLEPVHAPLALPAHVSKPSPTPTPTSKPIIGAGIPTNGTAVGLGLMSWCLDGEPDDDDDAPFVVGSVFMHPAMGRGLQIFLTLHEMAARSREQHGTLMKQWSTPTPGPAPAQLRPAPTPYLASSPILAPPKPVPARPPPPPKASRAKKPAPSTPAPPHLPPPGGMFVPHPHHAPYYHPHPSPYGMPMPWGPPPPHPPPPAGMDANAAMIALQQQAAKGEAADWTVMQQALSVLAPAMLPPMPPFSMPMLDPTAMSSPMPPRTPYHMPPPTPRHIAPNIPTLPPPPPPPQRAQRPRTKTPSPKPRPATPAQAQPQAQIISVTTPEPVPNVQYTLPRPPFSVRLGSQKENLPPRGTKRAAEPTPADSAPNKRPSPGQRFSDSTNTNATTNANTNTNGSKDRSDVFVRPMTPKARRPPPPQSSSPLFSTMRSGSSSSSGSHFSSNVGLGDPTLVMTSSPPHSLSSPTAVHISLSNVNSGSKKFADLPPSSPLPDDESCSSQMTTPGTGDENDNDADADGENDDDLEEVSIAPVQQSDQELCMELFGSMY